MSDLAWEEKSQPRGEARPPESIQGAEADPGAILAAQINVARRGYMVGMVLTILVLVGVVEFILMLILELEEHVPLPVAAVIDAALLTVIVTPLLWVLVVRKLMRDLRAESSRVALAAVGWRKEIESNRTDSQIVQGMEICDAEDEVMALVEASLIRLVPHCDGQLLLADSSQARLEPAVVAGAAGLPGCPVQAPADCPAVRGGHDLEFPGSDALDACPKLRARRPDPLAAMCIPVNVLGRSRGVLHVVGEPGSFLSTNQMRELRLVSSSAGNRLSMIRALADLQIEASVDSLTGLLNRRSLETRAGRLDAQAVRYVVAAIDLDNFKEINDTHGHLVGDKSLRLFAHVMRSTMRQADLLARVGGDEFVMVLPSMTVGDVSSIIGRLRGNLAAALESAAAPAFSISVGVADNSAGEPYPDVLVAADAAMYRAKNNGRDRLELAS